MVVIIYHIYIWEIYVYGYIMAGWWYTYSYEKYKFVSWDYDIPN